MVALLYNCHKALLQLTDQLTCPPDEAQAMLPEDTSCLCGAAFLDAALSHAVHLHTGATCGVAQPPFFGLSMSRARCVCAIHQRNRLLMQVCSEIRPVVQAKLEQWVKHVAHLIKNDIAHTARPLLVLGAQEQNLHNAGNTSVGASTANTVSEQYRAPPLGRLGQ